MAKWDASTKLGGFLVDLGCIWKISVNIAHLILYVLDYVTFMLPSAAAAALLIPSFAMWYTLQPVSLTLFLPFSFFLQEPLTVMTVLQKIQLTNKTKELVNGLSHWFTFSTDEENGAHTNLNRSVCV